MSQLYARIFVQILESSIAEDFTTRHIFEDFLKLADQNGIVDMTREAISRRLNVPLDTLNASITKLESPDLASRDPESEGRRLMPLDGHRNWGWEIVNWEKYEKIKTKAGAAERTARNRRRSREFDPHAAIMGVTDEPAVITAWEQWVQHKKEKRATITEQTAAKLIEHLKEWGAKRFIAAVNHSVANGWQGLFEPKTYGHNNPIGQQGPNRNAGTANEGKSAQYAGVGKLGHLQNTQRAAVDADASSGVAVQGGDEVKP